jgi:glycine cleavage system H protein
VGITALGIKLSGEIYMYRPKPVGQWVERGRSIAVAELAKAITAVKSPSSGQVVETSERLAAGPEPVHRDPYAQGRIARIAAWPASDPAWHAPVF